MNQRDDHRKGFHPGNPGFQESGEGRWQQDQYARQTSDRDPYDEDRYEQDRDAQDQYGRGGRQEGRYRGGRWGEGWFGGGRENRHRQRPSQGPYYGQERSGQGWSGHGWSGRGGSGQPQSHYFGTGAQGYGGGPSFTGGTYGMSDERSDSPYFQEVGFNRGYYEDPSAIEPNGPRGYPYPRAFGTPREEPRRRYPLGPKGYKRSDERLREDISERLMQAYHIDSSEVTVQVLGGRVVLEGTVPDRRMKHAIEDMACGAPGVEDVENRIRVQTGYGRSGSGSETRDAAQPLGGTSASPDAGSLASGTAGGSNNNGRSTRRDS